MQEFSLAPALTVPSRGLVSSPAARDRTLAVLDQGPRTAKQLRDETGFSRRYMFEILQDLQHLGQVIVRPCLRDTRQQWYTRLNILWASPHPQGPERRAPCSSSSDCRR